MNGLSKLGTILAVVFSVLVVAILAEICYVLNRRRKFRQRNRVVEDGLEQFSSDPFSHHDHPPPPSKELLYFFCWKTQTSIEPDGFHPTRVQPDAPPVADVDNVLMKWQGVYGPSRLLFTIKEEEREDVVDSPVEKTTNKEVVSLEEDCFGGGVNDEEATPFSTPCMSPFYYTPAASPTREVGNNGGSGGNMTDSTGNDDVGTVSFVSLEEVHGG